MSEEGVRLQKVLANAGVASRRVSEEMIAAGATRLGLSSSRDILADRSATGDY